MIYFTSDTHFGDSRVLRIDRRPFVTMAEHAAALISNWNERVAPEDEIWHLGDVCSPEILVQLERLALVRVVRGNCDDEPDWPLVLDIELEGHRFHLEHIPTNLPPPCDFFLHGHTHVPRDETIRGVRFLNPGCISRPRGSGTSFACSTGLWCTPGAQSCDAMPGGTRPTRCRSSRSSWEGAAPTMPRRSMPSKPWPSACLHAG